MRLFHRRELLLEVPRFLPGPVDLAVGAVLDRAQVARLGFALGGGFGLLGLEPGA
jgi:hypothetical protein